MLRIVENNYYFGSFRINRKQYQKIRYGSWAELPVHVIEKKLERQFKNKRFVESFQELYETILLTKEGQYAFGIAQEKVANNLIKFAKTQISEARKLVRKNKEKHGL